MSLLVQQAALLAGGGKVCTPSAAGFWSGSTGNFVFDGDDVYGGHGTNAAIRTTAQFGGDFDLHWGWASGGDETVIGVMPVSADGSFNSAASHAGMAGNGWYLYRYGGSLGIWNPSNGSASWGSQGQTVTHNPTGEVMRLSRSGGVLTLYGDESEIVTWSDTGSPLSRIVTGYGNSGSATDFNNMIWCQ